MKSTITAKKENALLKRTEIEGRILFDKATPSNANLMQTLSADLNIDKNLLIIKRISTSFGKTEACFLAYAYKDKAALKRCEPVTKHMKDQIKKAEEAKKAAEAKPAEKKEEAEPAEKKPEAKPAEKKEEAEPAEKKPEAKPAEKKPEAKPAEKKPEAKAEA